MAGSYEPGSMAVMSVEAVVPIVTIGEALPLEMASMFPAPVVEPVAVAIMGPT